MTTKKKQNRNNNDSKYSLNDLSFIVRGKSEYLEELIDKDIKENKNGSMGKRRPSK